MGMKEIRDKVKNLRRDFANEELSEKNCPADPLELFRDWMKQALDSEIKDANAFTISTYSNNEVDSRIVLIRDIYEDGLQFFTNYGSKKGQELAQHPQAAINFFWADLDRQLRIKAIVEKLDPASSDEYFLSRPRESRIGAWASQQSSKLESRESLENEVVKFAKEFEGKEVVRPDFWGGYLAKPYYYEFWQGRPSRLHDRIVYEEVEGNWQISRLYP